MMVIELPATTTVDTALLDWLAGHRVDYVLHEHEPADTALASAHEEHVDPQTFAKAVAVVGAGVPWALVVVPASGRVDLRKAAEVMGVPHVRLMTEGEVADLAPECELGSLPAVGSLFGVPTYADRALQRLPLIWFAAGSRRFCVSVDGPHWARAEHPIFGDLVL